MHEKVRVLYNSYVQKYLDEKQRQQYKVEFPEPRIILPGDKPGNEEEGEENKQDRGDEEREEEQKGAGDKEYDIDDDTVESSYAVNQAKNIIASVNARANRSSFSERYRAEGKVEDIYAIAN